MSKITLLDTIKKELLDIYKTTIESIKPNSIINESLKFDNNSLFIKTNDSIELNLENSNLHVIGGGKSALGMAIGLSKVVERSKFNNKLFSHGCLSLPRGLKRAFQEDRESQLSLNSINIQVHFGSGNNLPSEESVFASKNILECIKDACEFDKSQNRKPLFIVLVSGGGSACLTQPKYINLEKKLKLIHYLIQNGANIIELNKVRRYFSKIKGGQLARFILENHPDAQIVSLIMSDVIGDPMEFIASGPTVINNSSSVDHKKQMLDVLAKYSYPEKDLISLDDGNHDETNIEITTTKIECDIINRIVCNNTIALNTLSKKAESLGYRVELVDRAFDGDTEDIVAKMIEFSDKSFCSKECNKLLVIGGGEATVSRMPGEKWGNGGRLQEMAMDYMILKTIRSKTNHENLDIFLGASTDGQDGPTDVAACFASYYECENDHKKTFDLEALKRAKTCHDSYNFWTKTKPNWLIKTGLTGTNVMDLYLYSIIKK